MMPMTVKKVPYSFPGSSSYKAARVTSGKARSMAETITAQEISNAKSFLWGLK